MKQLGLASRIDHYKQQHLKIFSLICNMKIDYSDWSKCIALC